MQDNEALPTPMIMKCSKCNMVIADTYAFAFFKADLKLICFTACSNILQSDETSTSTEGLDKGSSYSRIFCASCNLEVGKIYSTTPRYLDDLRDLYCLSQNSISTYSFGQSEFSSIRNENSNITNYTPILIGIDAKNVHMLMQEIRKLQQFQLLQSESIELIEQQGKRIEELEKEIISIKETIHKYSKEKNKSRENIQNEDGMES